MKTFLFLIFILFVSNYSQAQTHLYEHPKFDEITKNHELVAILPFKTSITLRPKDMKDMSAEQLDRMEVSEGLSIQSAMHSWFLKREKRGTLKTNFQDPAVTNAKLKRLGVTFENIDEYTPEEIAKFLEVDGIIMGTFETNKPMSEGASATLGLLVGFYGSTNKAVINMSVYNAEDGLLLANYNKGLNGSIGTSTEDLINTVMRKASRRLSYSD
ncbi:hypothetical protein SAMN00777080_5090 [Aquiflexum balticum DSM 16537]|uniref:DUF4136 domain-containing protein n=1 Tax=Aquiflexum balticum DSM 16537 TaxID=758820 RepID=A0A1W2HCA5_9BACT|nr:hypothetical protein [Aquiflexum balticum]SMD46401.1 hypothetical protein SAMN00777080_5090 [Aquiflexum balticum DSM 16537]